MSTRKQTHSEKDDKTIDDTISDPEEQAVITQGLSYIRGLAKLKLIKSSQYVFKRVTLETGEKTLYLTKNGFIEEIGMIQREGRRGVISHSDKKIPNSAHMYRRIIRDYQITSQDIQGAVNNLLVSYARK